MKGIRSVFSVDLVNKTFDPLIPVSALDLKVKEKDIQNWIAEKPELLFTNPDAVLVIGQAVSGKPMPDLLAVDSQGTLFVFEIKRDSSDRRAVGQLQDYAAALSEWTRDDFNRRWQQNPKAKGRNLFEAFKDFSENSGFEEDEFLKNRRFFVLASAGSAEDESVKRIIRWLRDNYHVPIDFVPFQFYKRGRQHFLEIEKIDVDPMVSGRDEKWKGDWSFNTNERYCPGSYKKMLKDGVIAVSGYWNTKEKLNGPRRGDRIFAYLNGKGIIAVGRMGDAPAYPSGAVFNELKNREHNRKVAWETVALNNAITPAEVSKWGYNYPSLPTLCKIGNAKVADKIAKEMERRAAG
ncbi:MAG: hypothetical protein WAO35_16585 [Terriglobia bacterium]